MDLVALRCLTYDKHMTDRTVAVVGCGSWGSNYVDLLTGAGNLACVYDIDPSKTHTRLASLGLPQDLVAASWESLLSTPGVESLIIATPAHTHFALAQSALESGLHVLVEKPLTLLHSEARQLADTARSSNLVLAVGHLLRYHPAALQLREWLGSESSGSIELLDMRRVGPARLRPEHIFYSLAVHDVDMALFLGEDRPIAVTALGSATCSSDHAVLAIDFLSGWRATVTVSRLAPVPVRNVTAVGARMMAEWDQVADGGKGILRNYTYARQASGHLMVDMVSERVYPNANPLMNQVSDFTRAVAGSTDSRRRISYALDQATQGIAILETGLISISSNGLPTPLVSEF